MKRGLGLFAIVFILLFLGLANAECILSVSMINQDPYPATPGESVKVVFQIDGVSSPDCKEVEFEVKENFPFTIDPETENPIKINSGTYLRKYSSYYLAPYKIRIDKDALEGNMPIEVLYSTSSSSAKKLQEFNIYVENTKADFEVFVKDYNINTRILTLEILNTEDVDVEALTVEIPKQENIEIKGANRVIVGDLDSNEYTTAEFEASVNDGLINLTINYTDSINTRRGIEKTITFDSSYFNGLTRDQTSQPIWLYVIIAIVICFFVWRWWSKRQKRKKLLHKE